MQQEMLYKDFETKSLEKWIYIEVSYSKHVSFDILIH